MFAGEHAFRALSHLELRHMQNSWKA